MKLYYDLHIHSCLSPCGEEEMTPNNIVNMALLKGLDAIAVCDHNTAANVRAVEKAAAETGIVFVPGIEVATAEEVHLLAYFNEVSSAERFGELIYGSLPEIANKPDFFGGQLIMNEEDEVVGRQEKLLISASYYGIDECCALIRENGGVPVPAHINKDTNSILANLGFIPPGLDFSTVEVWRGSVVDDAVLAGYNVIYNSDAHDLGLISEKENFMELKEMSRECLLKNLK